MAALVTYVRVFKGSSVTPREATGGHYRTAVIITASPEEIIEVIAAAGVQKISASDYYRKGWIDMQNGNLLGALEKFRLSYAASARDRTKLSFVDAWHRFFDDLDTMLVDIRADFAAQRNDAVVTKSGLFVAAAGEFNRRGWLSGAADDMEALSFAAEEAGAYGDLAGVRTALERGDAAKAAKGIEACRERLAKMPASMAAVLQANLDKLWDRIALEQE